MEGNEVGLCSLHVDPFFFGVRESWNGNALRGDNSRLTGWCLRFVCWNESQLEWLAMIGTGFQNPPELRVPIFGAVVLCFSQQCWRLKDEVILGMKEGRDLALYVKLVEQEKRPLFGIFLVSES